tara:strand:+ start:9348 stop:10424 length:1077 start_codon:yes stop_codon:yes gene_type:complete
MFDVPQTKNQIMMEAIKTCKHLIEIDYLRDSVDIESQNNEDKIYAFTSTIKELKTNSKKDQEIIGRYKHLLFYDYPDFADTIVSGASGIPASPLYKSVLSELVTNIYIPELIKTQNNLDDISQTSTVEDGIRIISNNLSKIQKLRLSESRKWSVYVYVYKDILTELLSKTFNTNEVDLIQKLLNDVNVLLELVKYEIENMDLNTEKNDINMVRVKNKQYENLFDRIECIEVHIKESDDGKWLKDLAKGFSITMNGDKLFIRSDSSEKLMNLYSNISSNPQIIVFLRMNDCKETCDNTIQHVMETNASPWAYTYYLMFGENAQYTDENDKLVAEIIDVSKKLNLPIDYMFGMYKNAFRV